ncbi:MAG TPA: flagellar assembly protein FliX [Alphaproteobacteria bacterium]|nr:flagellar assembly protein FliX [Alphaproteobacteria bacterium]
MKVQGPSGPQSASPTRRTGKASGAGGSFDALIGGSDGPSGAAPAQASSAIARVDALLTIQGAEDPAQGAARKRMRRRSESILKALDGIRLSMLSGTLTVGHMIDVADIVAAHREKINDPQLAAIMDEIDLRAQVELAKMRMAMEVVREMDSALPSA